MGRVSELAVEMGRFSHRARATDPSTSHRAAARASLKPNSQGARVVLALLEMPAGGTCHEISAHCGLHYVRVARQMKMLEGKGRVKRTDIERPSPNGDACIVWVAS